MNKEQRIWSAYQAVFNTSHGRDVIEDMKAAHFYNAPTTLCPIDPYTLAFNEGQRNVILRVLAILESQGEEYGKRDNRSAGLDATGVNAAHVVHLDTGDPWQ